MRKVWTWIGSVLGPDEIVIACALILIAVGFTQMPSWSAGSYLAPGCVLLWISLPQRSALIRREQKVEPLRRKRA